MISVVIVNFHSDDADLLKRMKYNLEKAGFSLTESYTSGTVDSTLERKNVIAETLMFVYQKAHEC